jgi:hypothetical protein
MLAVALKFGFVLVIGVRAVVAAVLLLASDNALALWVFAFVLPLFVHGSLLKPRGQSLLISVFTRVGLTPSDSPLKPAKDPQPYEALTFVAFAFALSTSTFAFA